MVDQLGLQSSFPKTSTHLDYLLLYYCLSKLYNGAMACLVWQDCGTFWLQEDKVLWWSSSSSVWGSKTLRELLSWHIIIFAQKSLLTFLFRLGELLLIFDMYFYRTRVRSLFTLVTHWLTDSVTFSRLDWCDPGMWRWQLKLVEIVTVAYVDDEDRVSKSLLQI